MCVMRGFSSLSGIALKSSLSYYSNSFVVPVIGIAWRVFFFFFMFILIKKNCAHQQMQEFGSQHRENIERNSIQNWRKYPFNGQIHKLTTVSSFPNAMRVIFVFFFFFLFVSSFSIDENSHTQTEIIDHTIFRSLSLALKRFAHAPCSPFPHRNISLKHMLLAQFVTWIFHFHLNWSLWIWNWKFLPRGDSSHFSNAVSASFCYALRYLAPISNPIA